jgi:site-specific recombinase XerD
VAEQLSLPGTEVPVEESAKAMASLGLSAQSPLRAAMGAFEIYMQEQGFSENTIKAFLSDLKILAQFTGAGIAVDAISTRDLNRFTEWLVQGRGVPCNPKSLARRVTTLPRWFTDR